MEHHASEHHAEARRIVDALLDGSPGLLREVHALLRAAPYGTGPAKTPDDMTHKLVERQAIERAFSALARRRELEEESVTESELSGRPGYSPEVVARMRAGGGLLAIEIAYRPGYYYPLWQFDADWRPLAVLPRLTALSGELDWGMRMLNRWMTSELPDGGTPLDRLRRPGGDDEVVRLLRTSEEIF